MTRLVRKLITKRKKKKSPAQFVRNPVTQRWHLGYNCSGCLLGVRERAQWCQGGARACKCSCSLEKYIYNNQIIWNRRQAFPFKHFYFVFCSPPPPPRLHLLHRSQRNLHSSVFNLPPINKIQWCRSSESMLGYIRRFLSSWWDDFFFLSQEGKLSAISQSRSSPYRLLPSSLNLALKLLVAQHHWSGWLHVKIFKATGVPYPTYAGLLTLKKKKRRKK